MEDYKLGLKKEISKFLNCALDQVVLTWKGRVSLYGILKSLNLKENDEVIIPSFTCVVVSNAIIYNKLKPLYVDIEEKTFNIDTNKIEEKITKRTKVIISQNTFGLSSDIDRIKEIAAKHNLIVVDDCTHGFGGEYKGKKNGTNVDVSFFSSQWNKMFSTGIGGFIIVNNPIIKKKIQQFETELIEPSFKEKSSLKLQLFLKDLLGYKNIYWSALKFYRFLSKKNIVLGSSSGGELNSIEMPKDYLKGMSDVQCKKAITEIKRIDSNVTHRKNTAQYYNQILESLGKEKPFVPNEITHTYTKYPLLVRDREFIFKEAIKSKIPIHDWFISQIHPVEDEFEMWNLITDDYPVSKKIANHIINLPTDFLVTEKLKLKISLFLKKHKDQICSYNEL